MAFDRKYFLQRPFQVSFWARAYAKGIDFLLAFFLFILFPYPWGTCIGIMYLSYADALWGGQSVGKRWVGFSVISLEDGSPCTCGQSVIRNIPFLLPLLVLLYPSSFWRWVFLGAFFPPFIFLEVYILYKMGSGLRLGDILADTTVLGHDGFQKIWNPSNTKWIEQFKVASPTRDLCCEQDRNRQIKKTRNC